MGTADLSLVQGTLDVLILRTLAWGPKHGYAVARWISDATDEALRVEEGALYTSLYRMESRGWIESEWGQSDTGRRAKFYQLTRAGRQQLEVQTERWSRYVLAVSKVLQPG